jgi:hypothetical protein
MKRMAFAVLGAAAAASPVVLASACGNSVNPVGVPDAKEIEVGTSPDVAEADDAGDAEPDWWGGCPDLPVVCPDADYYFTVNGDGPEQILHSNVWTSPGWRDNLGPSPGDAGYHVPFARIYHWPENPPARDVSGSDSPDAGAHVEKDDGGGAVLRWAGTYVEIVEHQVLYAKDDTQYSSVYADAQADVVYTQADPPGGVVAGTYSVSVASPYDAGVLSIWGKFYTCRICDYP